MANNHLLTGDGLATAWKKMKTLIHSYISEDTANKLTGAQMASVSDGYRLRFGRSSGTTDEFTIPLSDKTTRAGLIKTTSTVTSATSADGYAACPVINGVPYYRDTDTRYSEVTRTSSGLATPAMYQAVEGSVNNISRSGVTLTLQKNNGTTSSVTLPNAATNVTGVVKTTSTVNSVNSADGYAACPIISGVPYYRNTDTRYSEVTRTSSGLATPAMYQAVEGSVNSISRSGVTLTLQKNNGTTSSITLPNAAYGTTGVVRTTSTVTSSSGYTPCPIISGVPYYKDTNTIYTNATSTKAGLMSAADYTKLADIGNLTTGTATATGFKNRPNEWARVASIGLREGTWLIFATAVFDSDSTGKRCIAISTTSADHGTILRRSVFDASKTGDTYVNIVAPISVSGATDIYINVNSTNTANTIGVNVHYAKVYIGA